eukprot:1156381-Pelagomonas_calceolata.AAC.3
MYVHLASMHGWLRQACMDGYGPVVQLRRRNVCALGKHAWMDTASMHGWIWSSCPAPQKECMCTWQACMDGYIVNMQEYQENRTFPQKCSSLLSIGEASHRNIRSLIAQGQSRNDANEK